MSPVKDSVVSFFRASENASRVSVIRSTSSTTVPSSFLILTLCNRTPGTLASCSGGIDPSVGNRILGSVERVAPVLGSMYLCK